MYLPSSSLWSLPRCSLIVSSSSSPAPLASARFLDGSASCASPSAGAGVAEDDVAGAGVEAAGVADDDAGAPKEKPDDEGADEPNEKGFAAPAAG